MEAERLRIVGDAQSQARVEAMLARSDAVARIRWHFHGAVGPGEHLFFANWQALVRFAGLDSDGAARRAVKILENAGEVYRYELGWRKGFKLWRLPAVCTPVSPQSEFDFEEDRPEAGGARAQDRLRPAASSLRPQPLPKEEPDDQTALVDPAVRPAAQSDPQADPHGADESQAPQVVSVPTPTAAVVGAEEDEAGGGRPEEQAGGWRPEEQAGGRGPEGARSLPSSSLQPPASSEVSAAVSAAVSAHADVHADAHADVHSEVEAKSVAAAIERILQPKRASEFAEGREVATAGRREELARSVRRARNRSTVPTVPVTVPLKKLPTVPRNGEKESVRERSPPGSELASRVQVEAERMAHKLGDVSLGAAGSSGWLALVIARLLVEGRLPPSEVYGAVEDALNVVREGRARSRGAGAAGKIFIGAIKRMFAEQGIAWPYKRDARKQFQALGIAWRDHWW